jgi:hypothetical protein
VDLVGVSVEGACLVRLVRCGIPPSLSPSQPASELRHGRCHYANVKVRLQRRLNVGNGHPTLEHGHVAYKLGWGLRDV